MPELTVSLPLWIIAQGILFVAIVLQVYAFQVRNKKKTLILAGLFSACTAVSSALLLNWVVFSLMTAAAVRNFVFAYLEHRKTTGKVTPQWVLRLLLVFFFVAFTVPVVFTHVWWLDWVLLAATLIIVYGTYANGIHIFRFGFVSFNSFLIVNHIVFFNIVGIIQSVLVISSIAVFYVRVFVKKRKLQVAAG